MMKSLSAAAALAALALPTAASAADQQRILGPADGVTATRTAEDKIDVHFTAAALAAARLKAGSAISATCRAHPARPALALTDDEDESMGSFSDVTAVVDGTAHVKLLTGRDKKIPRFDGCAIERLNRKAGTTVTVAHIGVTPAGLTWAADSAIAVSLRDLLLRARDGAAYKPAAELAGVTPLGSADAAPAAAQLGYWTDGASATAAALNPAGRRLVIQDLGGGMLRTNVFNESEPYIFDDSLFTADVETNAGDGRDPEEERGASPYKGRKPVSPSDGVRAATRGQRLVVRFTGRAAKAVRTVAGRKVMVVCFQRPPATAFARLSITGYGKPAMARVPSRGGRVAFTMKGAIGDACVIADDGTTIAIAAPTKTGGRWMHDLQAFNMFLEGEDEHLAPPGGAAYYATADAVAHSKGLVAMSGPTVAPPVGRVGVWTDGARHAIVATRSASGKAILAEDEGDGMLRTNVLSEFASFWLLLALDDGSAD